MNPADLITIDLDVLPPSLNNMFVNAGKKGRIPSKRYVAWRNEAGWLLARQHPGRIAGRYALEIYIEAGARADIGNLEKGLSDLLVSHGVVDDDSQAWALHLYRDPRIAKGCRLVVRPVLAPELELAPVAA